MENKTETLNFRVTPGVKKALELMQGPDESMRTVFYKILMGYLNKSREWWMRELDRATAEVTQTAEIYAKQLAQDDGSAIDRQSIDLTKRVLAQEENNKAIAERELARLWDIQKTAFPDMAIDESKE